MFFAPAQRSRTYVAGTRAYVPAARSFDRSFERFLADNFFGNFSGVQFTQDDAAWTVTLDVPGVAREQLSIEIDGAVVRIQTAAEAARQFKAAYELPEEIDADATEAELKDGVLTLKLGKKKPVKTARAIQIK